VPNKIQRTVYLSASLWAQIDDLIEYYGDSQSEVLTQILNEWFSDNQGAITDRKARIDGLRGRIQALQEQADKDVNLKRRR
jgi:hypothetical protein